MHCLYDIELARALAPFVHGKARTPDFDGSYVAARSIVIASRRIRAGR